MAYKMSQNSSANQKCTFCYNSLDSDLPHRQFLTQSVSLIPSCVKHIPKDICQTVNWSQYDDSNISSIFCTKCYDILGRLSKFDQELEEIQKKIYELVNLLVSHVKEQKTQNCGYTSSNSFILDANTGLDCENVFSQSVSEKDAIRREPNCSFDYYDEAEDLAADSVDSADTEYENPNDEITQQAVINTHLVTESDVSLFKPFVIAPEHVQPKSGLQKVLESSSGYPCPTCNRKFSRYTVMKKHDCSKPTVECETCGMSFSSGGVLKIHIRSHTGEKPYKCETCGKAFSIKHHLTEHMNLHTGKRDFECDVCQKTFKQSAALIKHKTSVHAKVEEKRFKCDVCSKNFKHLKALKLHMVQHSSGTSNPFKCDICEKAFPTSKCVICHIKRVHSQKEKPFKCDVCGKRFLINYELRKHMLTHETGKRFQCSYCEQSFKSESYLKIHELTHTQKGTFDCPTCGKAYKSSFLLVSHQRIHREKKICELCGKAITYGNMDTHLKYVHGNMGIESSRPHACKFCEMRFRKKACLVRHNEKYCHICGKLCRFGLLDHQIKVHTVKTFLYSDLEDEGGNTRKGENKSNLTGTNSYSGVPERRSRRNKSQKKINYDDSSSEDVSDAADSDDSTENEVKTAFYEEFKVEIKSEDEFSEIEDDFSDIDDF